MKKYNWFSSIIILITLTLSLLASAQIFIPFSFWRAKNQLTVYCQVGCYPTPDVQFTSSFYYIPIDGGATFIVSSTTNPADASSPASDNYNMCWGPTDAGGCDPTAFTGGTFYPVSCAGGVGKAGDIDGSSQIDSADYTPFPTANVSDTCWVTDYNEGQASASFVVRTFNPVAASPTSSLSTPLNVCVNQTQALTGSGGVGTLNWSVVSGSGSVAPSTGTATTYTAPATTQLTLVQLRDATTSMTDQVYFNVVNTISITPVNTVEVTINNSTLLQYPATAGVSYTANLNFSANCGLPNYTITCTGGCTASPSSGVTNNSNVRYTPAATTSTGSVKFTDSTPVTPQTATRTVYNIVPVDVTANWGYHFCVKYTHSTYTAGTYKIKCWGRNTNGELGYGTTTHKGISANDLGYGLPFVKDTGNSGSDMMVKDISAGLSHTCAILSNNTVKCWGLNTYGQLGYDNTTQLTSPSASTVNIGAGTPTSIYAFGYKSCVVFSDNRVKCWGRNARGDLGQNNTTNYGSAGGGSSMASLNYIQIGGSDLTVQKISGGENYTCALSTSTFGPGASKVYCWGYGNSTNCAFSTMPDGNYCGELGRATTNANWGDGTNNLSGLSAVNLGLTGSEVVIDIVGGRKHVCALIAPNSVSVVGTPICWGRNSRGQLGINNTNVIGDNETPTTRGAAITTASFLRASGEATCAVLSTGDLRCWGRGGRGQLLGSNSSGGSYTTNQADGSGPNLASAVNAKLGTSRTIKKIAMAYDSSCAILDNDYIKCWGSQYCGTGSTSSGCVMSGLSTVTNTNPVAPPNMMSSRYIGDNAAETGDLLPYVNH
ncbi:MAG: hypothetical protein ACXWPX_04385 [Pseudobdellovibrio sp.]